MRFHDDKKETFDKQLMVKKAKRDFLKVKCFNCDNHRPLVKDCPKPPQVNDYISQGEFIFQGGFMVEIWAHESEFSNLLKLKCKTNTNLSFIYGAIDTRHN